jgi:hypothetical protein
MTSPIRISTTILLALLASGFGTASCSNSNPPSITYKQEVSIYQGTGGDSGDAGDGGSVATCTDLVFDAATRPKYACSSNWLCTHPLAQVTVAGDAVGKGVACVPQDQQIAYKSCGPDNSGYKSETCSGGVYAEQSDCSFDPACDFSCFKLPDTADPNCPTTPPTHGTPCTLPQCVVCGGTKSGQTTGYLDSKRSAKIGFCVCLPATATTTQKWSCATSGTIWPCPGNNGC